MLSILAASLALLAADDPARIRAADVALLEGAPWKGSLTYRDYQSNKLVKIPCTFAVTKDATKPDTWKLAFDYPEEPGMGGASDVSIRHNGLFWGSELVVSRRTDFSTGGVTLTTVEDGTDNGKPAEIRRIYTFSSKVCGSKKMVRYRTETKPFFRHEYRFTRA